MSASFPCSSNIFEKRNTQKVLKATLSRLLSSKFEKSFIQPFIRYHSHFLPLSGTEDLSWPMDYRGSILNGSFHATKTKDLVFV